MVNVQFAEMRSAMLVNMFDMQRLIILYVYTVAGLTGYNSAWLSPMDGGTYSI